MFTDNLTSTDVEQGVEDFNVLYSDMELALWCLSRATADALLERKESPVIGEFIWAIKSWWGIQGVQKETKIIAANSLLRLGWDSRMLGPNSKLEPDDEKFAVERLAYFVNMMRRNGAPRYEWSLASKVLHWLMPWRIPVYDSFVKKSVGISVDANPKEAYEKIVRAEFAACRKLLIEGQDWFGDVEPKAPFRALDKYLWRLGGGSADRAVIVKDPWKIIRSLGLTAPD